MGEHPSNTAASSALLSVGATQPRSEDARVDNGKLRSAASVQQAGSTGALENETAAAADEPDGIDAVRTARSVSNGRENRPDSDRATGNHSHAHRDGPVTLASDRSFPAPAAHPLSPTTAGLIEALAARGQATPAPLALHQQPATVAVPTHIMKIELHPAELGIVVANLRMSGGQLSVELKPETAEAYRHLSSDSDTIAKSLKKLGLDVGSVTVLQPSVATTPVTRTDAGNQTPSMPGRDASQFQSGTSAGGGDNSGGQQSGRNRNHDGQALDRPASAHRERPGGSLFI
jgi:chemotaxis protein MotD